MGMDPPKEGETHVICVELKGPVSKAAFEDYKRMIRRCLRELGRVRDRGKRRRLRVSRRHPSIVRYPPLHAERKKASRRKRRSRKR